MEKPLEYYFCRHCTGVINIRVPSEPCDIIKPMLCSCFTLQPYEYLEQMVEEELDG